MKIAVVTGSRADRGPLESVRKELSKDHRTYMVDVGPRLPVKDVDRNACAYLTSEATSEIGINFTVYKPDLAVILGDRYEILGAAVAANILGVPIAHLSGGDITEGSQDDCYRHAITKLSHIHFPTNAASACHIIQMGEEPDRVFECGSPSIDLLLSVPLVDRASALKHFGLTDGKFVLVSLHPNTFGSTASEIEKTKQILDDFYPGLKTLLLEPNADAGRELIRKSFLSWIEKSVTNIEPLWPNESRFLYCPRTLPRELYLSLMKHCEVMIGNSSAMLYEAPTLGTKTIMIGDRQKGRDPITGDGHAAKRIAAVIYKITEPQKLLRKRFVQWPLVRSGRPHTNNTTGASTPQNSLSSGLPEISDKTHQYTPLSS